MLNIRGIQRSETVKVTITDVTSRIVLSQNIFIEDYKSRLSLDLKNGIYFVTLINQAHERVVQKPVISK